MKTNTKQISWFSFVCLLLASCSNQSINQQKNTENLPPVRLSNGEQANNCEQYNQLRKQFRLSEDVASSAASQDYLLCSLKIVSIDDSLNENTPQNLISTLMQQRIRSLPLSINPQYDRQTNFETAGFNYLQQNGHKLVWKDKLHQISLEFKGSTKQGELLFWVRDEINDGSYRAYFPFIFQQITKQDAKDAKSSANWKIQPVYRSGF